MAKQLVSAVILSSEMVFRSALLLDDVNTFSAPVLAGCSVFAAIACISLLAIVREVVPVTGPTQFDILDTPVT